MPAKLRRNIEDSYRRKQTGRIDPVLIKELNIPVEDRIKQMLLNFERIK